MIPVIVANVANVTNKTIVYSTRSSNPVANTEIIVASIRHPMHVLESARLGADIATIPYKVIAQLAHHPLTDIGLEKFLSDWEKVPKN